MSGKSEVKDLCRFHGIAIDSYKGNQRKDKIARNLVDYEAGETILQTALGIDRRSVASQISFFDQVAHTV
jgi:DNA (cytosine-5)-methyltransferase 1